MAAPAMPQWKTRTKIRSSTILVMDAAIMAWRGVLLSPKERRMEADRLYAMITGIPRKMIRRYNRELSIISSGVCNSVRIGWAHAWLMTRISKEQMTERIRELKITFRSLL